MVIVFTLHREEDVNEDGSLKVLPEEMGNLASSGTDRGGENGPCVPGDGANSGAMGKSDALGKSEEQDSKDDSVDEYSEID